MLDIDTCQRQSDLAMLAVLQAPDWSALTAAALTAAQALGASDFMLHIVLKVPSEESAGHIIGSLPAPLLQLFDNQGQGASDPVQRHVGASVLPLAWQSAQLGACTTQSLYRLLDNAGLRHGLTIPLRSANAASRLDFYASTPGAAWPPAQQASLALLGLYLHEAAEAMWRRCAPVRPALLSSRELECLEWVAAGKTSSEVGAILGITQRTVYFHLSNVAAKLNVYGTRHSIGRATALGILQPRR